MASDWILIGALLVGALIWTWRIQKKKGKTPSQFLKWIGWNFSISLLATLVVAAIRRSFAMGEVAFNWANSFMLILIARRNKR